jgi:DNA polymerase I-like protein with 3'-5' exonuclease and polymerase domains
MLSPLRSKTGSNQPASGSFVLGKPAWFRSLIRPEPGQALAYIDWEQQEFGIAAALSRDSAMMDAYRSGDPYLAFARQAGRVPPDATKSSHPAERELFKQCALAVLYGMSADGLARKLGIPHGEGAELLRLHRRVYRRFWEWSDAMVDGAMLLGRLQTVFGWKIHVSDGVNSRMLRNFPMQANGAEMMRIAAILMTERGIRACAPLHDAFLIDGAIREIDEAVVVARSAMAEASIAVLGEFELRSDVTITCFPDRFVDRRGKAMWDRVSRFLEPLRTEQEFVGAS